MVHHIGSTTIGDLALYWHPSVINEGKIYKLNTFLPAISMILFPVFNICQGSDLMPHNNAMYTSFASRNEAVFVGFWQSHLTNSIK